MDDAVVVAQVAAGNVHSMALTTTGELYAWGVGDSGRLGHGGGEDLAVPRVVEGIGAVTGMAGGDTHSLVTTAEERVLAFGCNGADIIDLLLLLKILTEKNRTEQSLKWTVGWGSGWGWRRL